MLDRERNSVNELGTERRRQNHFRKKEKFKMKKKKEMGGGGERGGEEGGGERRGEGGEVGCSNVQRPVTETTGPTLQTNPPTL